VQCPIGGPDQRVTDREGHRCHTKQDESGSDDPAVSCVHMKLSCGQIVMVQDVEVYDPANMRVHPQGPPPVDQEDDDPLHHFA
jgi:hypothetical protein